MVCGYIHRSCPDGGRWCKNGRRVGAEHRSRLAAAPRPPLQCSPGQSCVPGAAANPLVSHHLPMPQACTPAPLPNGPMPWSRAPRGRGRRCPAGEGPLCRGPSSPCLRRHPGKWRSVHLPLCALPRKPCARCAVTPSPCYGMPCAVPQPPSPAPQAERPNLLPDPAQQGRQLWDVPGRPGGGRGRARQVTHPRAVRRGDEGRVGQGPSASVCAAPRGVNAPHSLWAKMGMLRPCASAARRSEL
jgi:hypothetical protein